MKYPFNPFSFYNRRPNFCQSFKKSEMSVRGLNFTYCRNDFSWDFQAWFWFQTSYQIKFKLLYERWTSGFFFRTQSLIVSVRIVNEEQLKGMWRRRSWYKTHESGVGTFHLTHTCFYFGVLAWWTQHKAFDRYYRFNSY